MGRLGYGSEAVFPNHGTSIITHNLAKAATELVTSSDVLQRERERILAQARLHWDKGAIVLAMLLAPDGLTCG